MLKIYNSLSRKAEPFKPIARRMVKLYTCGPTVYSRPHLGNYRTYLWEDTFKRYLLYSGYKVRHVMNITDYDNTILREVRRTGIPRGRLTGKNERLFRADLASLGAIPADKYPHVSKYANKMARRVIALLKKGLAYKDERGRVFFDISKFKSYGQLAGKRISNSRMVDWEEYKPSQAGDFMVWRPCVKEDCHDGFDSVLGWAHPPWNIQCATMSTDCLGSRIDVAMGGTDNKFNHHENTRAIAGALSGREYAKYWVHIRHLIINGHKMSKRKGNAVLLPDMVRRGFSPKAVRFLLLCTHYRKKLDFTWARAEKTRTRYRALAEGIGKLKKSGGSGNAVFGKKLARLETDFVKAMDSDLNVPRAIAAIERLVSSGTHSVSKRQASQALALLQKFDAALACLPL